MKQNTYFTKKYEHSGWIRFYGHFKNVDKYHCKRKWWTCTEEYLSISLPKYRWLEEGMQHLKRWQRSNIDVYAQKLHCALMIANKNNISENA